MPQFYEKMKTRLRTVEEGADTIVWLAIAENPLKLKSGCFYQGKFNIYLQTVEIQNMCIFKP
jgi:dehydrogenase/reductase SDR family protein 12